MFKGWQHSMHKSEYWKHQIKELSSKVSKHLIEALSSLDLSLECIKLFVTTTVTSEDFSKLVVLPLNAFLGYQKTA